MKKGLIVFVVVMLAGGLAYPLLKGNSGYILIAFNHTTIDMSIWTGLFLLIFTLLALSLVWRLVLGGRRMANFLGSHGARASVRAQQRTMAALVDFMAGNWHAASKILIKNADKSPNALVNYLAAARCSYELDDIEQALALLHKAESSGDTGSNHAVALIQAQMLFDSERYEQSLAILNRVKRSFPESPSMLNLLVDVYWVLEDHDGLKNLLPALERHNVRTKEEIEKIEVDLLKRQFNANATVGLQGATNEARNILNKTWDSAPSKLHKNPVAMAAYAAQLHQLGDVAEAESWALKSIKKHWDANTVMLFGCIESNNAAAQLQAASRWLSSHENDAALLCALGRISMRNKLWGKAQDYFQKSLAIHSEPEVYAQLAQLRLQLGDIEGSNAMYKKGLHSIFETQSTILV